MSPYHVARSLILQLLLSCVLVPLILGPISVFSTASSVVPDWAPTYNMPMSTIMMTCNASGFFDPNFSAKWGVVDIDWSNAKAQWCNQKPMDCEERLVTQVEKIKAINPKTRVFVYRNLVKALPWYTAVREKLEDPAYADWFLRFKDGVNGSYHQPPCTGNKCSGFYHDQDQTPKHPHGDGSCIEECDCGSIPCGEYLWNHRNASLRTWLIDHYIMGPTGLGNPLIDGFYTDDGWTNYSHTPASWWPKEGFCSADVIGGPSEEYRNCTVDMGLVQDDTTKITDEWRKTMGVVHTKAAAAKAFIWQMFHTVSGAPNKEKCTAFFKKQCKPNSTTHDSALMFQFSKNTNNKPWPLPNPTEDLASFLLVRGPYGWIGYAWVGCHSETPGGSDGPFPRPASLDVDYGEPTEFCHEEKNGIFVRKWTKATVQFDCNSWNATITMK